MSAALIARIESLRDEHSLDYDPEMDFEDGWCAECADSDNIVPWPCPERRALDQIVAILLASTHFLQADREEKEVSRSIDLDSEGPISEDDAKRIMQAASKRMRAKAALFAAFEMEDAT